MSWANWGIASWFLLLIPALVLLYFLKVKRRDLIVSSTLLWSRVLQDRRVNSPFQRLRKSLLLLLQLLVLLALILALARPEHQSETVAGRVHVLLLDVSASMATAEGKTQRFEVAKQRVESYLDAVPKGESAVLVSFAQSAKAVTPVTEDLRQVRSALRSLQLTAAATSIDEAMELALSIARALQPGNEQQPPDVIVQVFSDGQFPEWVSGEVPLPVEFQRVGDNQQNSGIVALSTRMDLSGSGRPQVFVEVRNFGSDAVQGLVSISQSGNVLRAATAELAAGDGRWSSSFEAFGAGVVEVLWEPEGQDYLDADNVAWIDIAPQPDLTVWRVGAGHYFLDSALEVLPRVKLQTMSLADYPARLAAARVPPDVIIWDRECAAELPEVRGHLCLGVLPPRVWPENVEKRVAPEIVSWDRRHPVNRFLSYARVNLGGEATILPAQSGSAPLVDTRGGALISTFSMPASRGVVVAFDMLDSDWPTDLSFSLFLYNAVVYLSQTDVGAAQMVRGGELVALQARDNVDSSFQVTRPDGKTEKVAAEAGGWLRYGATEILGTYTVRWRESDANGVLEEVQRTVPVNLLSSRESRIAPLDSLALAGREVESSAVTRTDKVRDFWPYLACLGLILLLLEWAYFHRH